MSPWRQRQVIVAVLGIAVILFVGIGVLTYNNTRDLIASDDLVSHSYEVLASLESTYAALADSESARRGLALSGDPQYVTRYMAARQRYAQRLDMLMQLTADNAEQRQGVRMLSALADEKDGLLQQTLDLQKSAPLDAAQQSDLTARAGQLMTQIRAEVSDMEMTENALLQSRHSEARSNAQDTLTAIIAGYIFSVALLGVVFARLIHELDVRRTAEQSISRLNQELTARISELTRLNRELQEFSYSMSHDLRQPLRALDGFSLALLEDYASKFDAVGQDYLTRIRAAAQRMGQLIDDWVNLTRVTRMEMRRVDVDLSALVAEIVARLRSAQPAHEVSVIVAPDVHAEGDPVMLRLALGNLLENAWKFSGEKPHAHIEFGRTEAHGKPCYFVRDDGVGFDAAYADKLFGAFERLHGANEFPGTGMGLAIVRRIITRHGGRVWAEGSLGNGAQFYFTLN